LDYQNNYKRNSIMMSNDAKHFDILGTSQNILHNFSYTLSIILIDPQNNLQTYI